jgi:CRP-like cAMP-binding protein
VVVIEELLRRVHLFADLEPEELRRLAAGFSEQLLPSGYRVYRFGDPSDAFYLIREGSVALYRDEPGRPVQLQARLGVRDYFGELGLFENVVRAAAARTGETTRLLRISRDDLLAFLDDHPEVALRLQIAAARRHTQNISTTLDLGGRKEVRIRLGTEVDLELSDGSYHRGTLENLSLGGMCLSGAHPEWEKHWRVRFEMVHGDDRLQIVGRIAWRQSDTVGIAFSRPFPEHEDEIRGFLRKLLEETGLRQGGAEGGVRA